MHTLASLLLLLVASHAHAAPEGDYSVQTGPQCAPSGDGWLPVEGTHRAKGCVCRHRAPDHARPPGPAARGVIVTPGFRPASPPARVPITPLPDLIFKHFPYFSLALPCIVLPAVGRRLLSRPDGRQPWKNAPPGNMTVVIHFNQLGQLAIRQTSTGLQLAAKYLALVAQAQRAVAQRYRRPDMQVAAAGESDSEPVSGGMRACLHWWSPSCGDLCTCSDAWIENCMQCKTVALHLSKMALRFPLYCIAAAYAGHAVLTRLFPLLSVNFDAVMPLYTDGLTPVQLNQVSQQGINVAQKLVAQRSACFHPASRSAIPPSVLPSPALKSLPSLGGFHSASGSAILPCPSFRLLPSEAFHLSAAGCPAVHALTAAASLRYASSLRCPPVLACSLTDGLAEWADWYTPPVGPQPAGVYAFTPGQTFALLPQLARTRALVIPRLDPFEQGGPNPAGSPAFAADLAEVRDVGQKGFAEPQDVTTAQFWFNGPGKKPHVIAFYTHHLPAPVQALQAFHPFPTLGCRHGVIGWPVVGCGHEPAASEHDHLCRSRSVVPPECRHV